MIIEETKDNTCNSSTKSISHQRNDHQIIHFRHREICLYFEAYSNAQNPSSF